VSRRQILPFVLLVLTGLTGMIDAVSFLSFGHVFTANMTGNVVFIAFACAGVPGLSVARSGTALIGFLAGVALGARMTRDLDGRHSSRRVAAGLFAQASALLFATVVTFEFGNGMGDDQTTLYVAIALTAVAMGIQNVITRNIALPGFSPNVLTGALTGFAGDVPLGTRDPLRTRRLASVAAMFAGAFAGAWLWHGSRVWPLAISTVVSGVCGLAMVRNQANIAVAV
jgi:uncharacterized membrane protein YoaK (UPF0700 family)